MKFLIQMRDGTYYMEAPERFSNGAIFTSSKLTEAKLFDTRFQALSVMGRSVVFANSKIIPFDPEVKGDGCRN